MTDDLLLARIPKIEVKPYSKLYQSTESLKIIKNI